MKLRNKKTGEIKAVQHGHALLHFSDGTTKSYKTVDELNAEWEDYEEPKGHWYLNYMGDVLHTEFESINPEKKIGNYFLSREEAKKAVEKLKAVKRLRDNNLRLRRGCITFVNTDEVFTTMGVDVKVDTYANVEADLDLLFSGGEE